MFWFQVCHIVCCVLGWGPKSSDTSSCPVLGWYVALEKPFFKVPFKHSGLPYYHVISRSLKNSVLDLWKGVLVCVYLIKSVFSGNHFLYNSTWKTEYKALPGLLLERMDSHRWCSASSPGKRLVVHSPPTYAAGKGPHRQWEGVCFICWGLMEKLVKVYLGEQLPSL